MRGGSRLGAGRKPGVPSVIVRVPLPCLAEVRSIIERFRQTVLDSVTEIEKVNLNSVTGDNHFSAPSSSVKPMPVTPLTDAQKRIRKSLERLPKAVQRNILAQYGTLTEAVRAGVLPDGQGSAVLNRFKG